MTVLTAVSPVILPDHAQTGSSGPGVLPGQSTGSKFPVSDVGEIEGLSPGSKLDRFLRENFADFEKSAVKGSLARNANAWRSLTSDPQMLAVVRDGYSPPFQSVPPAHFRKNNTSAMRAQPFVLKAVCELLVNGFAKLAPTPPLVTNPFTVSIQANGKKRLIADLQHLNQFLDPPSSRWRI